MMSRRSSLDKIGPILKDTVGEDYFAISAFVYGPNLAWGVAWTFNKDIKLYNANNFTQLVFHERHAMKPVKYCFANTSFEDAINFITDLFNNLKITINVQEKLTFQYVAILTADDETWIERKREVENNEMNYSKKLKIENNEEFVYNDDFDNNYSFSLESDDDSENNYEDRSELNSSNSNCVNISANKTGGISKSSSIGENITIKQDCSIDETVINNTTIKNEVDADLMNSSIELTNKLQPILNARLEMSTLNKRNDVEIIMTAIGKLPYWQPVHQIMKLVEDKWKLYRPSRRLMNNLKKHPKFMNNMERNDSPLLIQGIKRTYESPQCFQDNWKSSIPPSHNQDYYKDSNIPPQFQNSWNRSDFHSRVQEHKSRSNIPPQFQNDRKSSDLRSQGQEDRRGSNIPPQFHNDWKRSDLHLQGNECKMRSNIPLQFQNDWKRSDPYSQGQEDRTRSNITSQFQNDWQRFDNSRGQEEKRSNIPSHFQNHRIRSDLHSWGQESRRWFDLSQQSQDNERKSDPYPQYQDNQERSDSSQQNQDNWNRSNSSQSFQSNQRTVYFSSRSQLYGGQRFDDTSY